MPNEKEALNPFDQYHKYVGSKPMIDTAASTTAGTALGYYGSNVLLNPLVKALAGATGASPEKVKKVQSMIRRYGALLGGGGGLLYGLGKHMDTGSGIGGAFKSMVGGSDYWKDNPMAASKRMRKFHDTVTSGRRSIRTPDILKGLIPKGIQEAVPTQEELQLDDLRRSEMQRMMQLDRLQRVRAGLQKQQSYQDPFAGADIPLDYAMSVIQRDPFLSLGKKTVTRSIFDKGSDDGRVTGPGIMKGALRFGVGMVPAYLLGKNMANILSMDPKKAKIFSGLGGVAIGVMNTGIFGD